MRGWKTTKMSSSERRASSTVGTFVDNFKIKGNFIIVLLAFCPGGQEEDRGKKYFST